VHNAWDAVSRTNGTNTKKEAGIRLGLAVIALLARVGVAHDDDYVACSMLTNMCLTTLLQNTSAQWWDKPAILVGSLIGRTLISNRTLTDAFLWTSHSFTHQNMNNATYSDCQTQWGLNKAMAELLQLDKAPGYSSAGVVTPQISGADLVWSLCCIRSRCRLAQGSMTARWNACFSSVQLLCGQPSSAACCA
jgi:hypothetical protein